MPAQALRFSGVGVANSIIYFVLAAMLNGLLGLPVTPASVIAYTLAGAFAYLAHKYMTFASKDAALTEVPKFIAASALGLALAVLIPILLHAYAPVISFMTVLLIVPLCSFLMMKLYVFRS